MFTLRLVGFGLVLLAIEEEQHLGRLFLVFLRLVATFLRVAYINYQRPAAGESEGQRTIKQIEFKKKKR